MASNKNKQPNPPVTNGQVLNPIGIDEAVQLVEATERSVVEEGLILGGEGEGGVEEGALSPTLARRARE